MHSTKLMMAYLILEFLHQSSLICHIGSIYTFTYLFQEKYYKRLTFLLVAFLHEAKIIYFYSKVFKEEIINLHKRLII